MIDKVYAIVDDVRSEYALDPRAAVFEVEVGSQDGELVVYGASSVPQAVEELHARIAALDDTVPIRDEVLRLPAAMDGRPPHAVVSVATAPMLAAPIISGSYLSTVLLGHRVMVLREYGRWQQCRAPDGYLGWIHRGYLKRLSEAEARSWEIGATAPQHYSLGAEVLDGEGEVMVRLPWGARVCVRDGVALLPDGRTGTVRGDVLPLAELGSRFPLDPERIVATTRQWSGTPYLWGGVTPWGVDCSGLVQAVYKTHGVHLPRDSDQQALEGVPVEHGDDFSEILPGDLLFFAERQDRVSHVAISTGGSRIIHSAVGNGGVSTNDLCGDNGYERDLRSLLVTVRRIVSQAP